MDLPRVTEILRNYTNYDKVPSEILDKAATRGTTVHALCAGIAKGAWIPDGMIDPNLRGYINSFQKWAQAQVKKFSIVEKRFADPTLNYTGQLDFVVEGTDGELYLVDIKTSASPQKTFPVQMAAYNNLLKINGVYVKGAILVYLKKDGEFPEVYLLEDLVQEWSVFVAALECWNYFHKGKKNVRKNTKRAPKNIEDNVGATVHS